MRRILLLSFVPYCVHEITNMVFFLLFLTMFVTHGYGDIYDVYAPEDYLNHFRNGDIHNRYREEPGDKMKYDDILSILHNEHSNQALLAQINNPSTVKNRLWKDIGNNHNTSEGASLTPSNYVPVQNIEEFKDNTRHANKDWNRLKRDDDDVTNKDAERIELKVIPVVSSNSNRFESNHEKELYKKIGNNDQNFKRIAAVPDYIKIKINELSNSRPKRHSAFKLLRSMFHPTSTSEPKSNPTQPLYLRESKDVNDNSTFIELIENLMASIKTLNEHLAYLKLHANENEGFLMIKVPLSEMEVKRYSSGIKEDGRNKTKYNYRSYRSRRDVSDMNTDDIIISKNYTMENDTTHFNITVNDNSIIDAKENIEPTIVSDSEIINKLNELNKSKRDINVTSNETYNITNNVTEKSINISNSRRFNTNEAPKYSTRNESNDLKSDFATESEMPNSIKTPKENARKFIGYRDDLLFFIENAYGEIKNLITPMNYLKEKYSNETLYKIGYIIGNLETMDGTLIKLKSKLYTNEWNSQKLQKVLKKLRMSKELVMNVMRVLKQLKENQSIIDQSVHEFY